MILRRWLVVARGYGEQEPVALFMWRFAARYHAKRYNCHEDEGWVYTIERVTRPCKGATSEFQA